MECSHKIVNLKNYFCIVIKNMARLDFFRAENIFAFCPNPSNTLF